jgi:hypothetical protein
MGFLAAQYFFTHQPEGSPTAQICIMSRASRLCLDETAFLEWPTDWLALKCAVLTKSDRGARDALAKHGIWK